MANAYMRFSPSQARMLIVVPVFALLSALALSFIVYRCIRLVVIPSFQRNATTPRAPENLFFRTHLGQYAASLVFSNVVLTSAGLMEFFWVRHSGMRSGSFCNAQAALMQTGCWATCFFSVAIGIHTCSSLVFRRRQINWVPITVSISGWIISLVIGLGPLSAHDIYGPGKVSCSVVLKYPNVIFGLKSFPVLIGSVLAVIVYSLIFLVLRGFLRVRGGIKFTCIPQEQWSVSNNSSESDRFMGAIANSMFWYPVAFVLLLLPFTISNLIQYRGQSVSFGFSVFVNASWSILGLVNVALLYNTFRVLSPVFHDLTLPRVRVNTEKNFGNNASDESPIPPPPAHSPKGPLLPLYREVSKSSSQSLSPLSLSEFPEVTQHSRNSSTSSTDSMTYLLSVKRKPSRYHSMRVRMQSLSQTILPTAELNRQLGGSYPESIKSHSLQLDLHVAKVITSKPTLETVSLSPAPRSAVASVLTTSPIAPTSPIRQITLAFGRPARKANFGPRSKGGGSAVAPPLSPIPSVESPTSKPETGAAQLRESSTGPTKEQRPSQLDLTGVTPIKPVRPLPAMVERVDKGKGRMPPVPPPVHKDITSRSDLRPLPQFPRNSVASSSSSEGGSDDLLLSVTSFLSLSSPQPSFNSGYSSNASAEGAGGKALQTQDDAMEEDSANSEPPSLSINTRGQDLTSRRVTQASVWSQESLMTASQPPDMEAALVQLLLRAQS